MAFVVKALMRVFSYIFHGILALFLLGLSVIALSSGQVLRLDMLPWQGKALTYWLLAAAVVGLALVVMAIRRVGRPFFFLWSLVVLLMMARGFFFSPYHFEGAPDFHRALWLLAGAIIAVFGAWFVWRREALR